MKGIEKTNEPIHVEMSGSNTAKATRIYNQTINGFGRLGRELKISPKAHVLVNGEGYKSEYFVETVSVVIGIGKNHSADLVMSKDAWDALCSGEKITIETLKEFKDKYIRTK